MTEQLFRWVKASERMPEGRVIIRWHKSGNPDWERIEISDKRQIEMFDNVSEIPTIEWLEPYTQSPVSGSLELPEGLDDPFPTRDVLRILINATEILLDKKNYDGPDHEEIFYCVKRAKEILSLPSRPSLDIDKVVERLRGENPYCGEIDFSEDARIAWEKSCDKLKELLDKNT